MRAYLWEKIHEVRKQPEHIRRRYVFICLTVSMIFIVGIWLLSLSEDFNTIITSVPKSVEKGKEQLKPKDDTPSLNELLDQAVPLRVHDTGTGSEENYFQSQVEEKKNSDGAGSETSQNEGITVP